MTGSGGAPIPICSGPTSLTAKTAACWSPAAAPPQAAKYALRWPHARVTGIDLTATSIEKTEALKRKYGLDNLDVHQLPVERATELGHGFEHVVCTGVLHHLPDADAGLRRCTTCSRRVAPCT